MAITQTALAADLTATAKTMTVSSGTGFPTSGGPPVSPGYVVRIDREYMLAVQQPTAGVIKIAQRGYNGTFAESHDTLAKVEVSSVATDFAGPSPGNVVDLPPYQPLMQTLGEDYTFTSTEIAALGNQPKTYAILKGSAIAITLVAPSKAQDGLVLTFTSLTAFLHVITATALLANGGTGSPYTTATGAHTKVGATLVLQAQNGLWNVVSASNFTIT
jgi:hypothetical protein